METSRKDLSTKVLNRTSCSAMTMALALWTAVPSAGAKVLVIYGNSNGTVTEGNYSLGDAWVKQRLETALHHQVRFMWDLTPKAQMLAAADSADLVMVLESTTSTNLTDKLKTTPVPIMSCEAMIQDDLGLTATGTSCDPGPPSKCPYGVVDSAADIVIKDSSHPLAAGLHGQIHVYSAMKEINWGKVAATAHVIATLASDPSGAAIYTYEKGDKLFDGTTAAGLRIGFFVEDDNKTGTATLFTPEGVKLFDAAVNYGLGGTTTALGRTSGDGIETGKSGAEIPGVDALGRRAPDPGNSNPKERFPAPGAGQIPFR
jgi:hypothetical protein